MLRTRAGHFFDLRDLPRFPDALVLSSPRVFGKQVVLVEQFPRLVTETVELVRIPSDSVYGEEFTEIKRSERRYLVIGRGGDDGPGQRRKAVCKQLDERLSATAFRLEDFGLRGEVLELWVPAFDILSEMASHIIGIVEDYDGGHVWELGFLYRYQSAVRNTPWLLKRVYDSSAEMREHYDNGLAASHLAALENAAGTELSSERNLQRFRL